MKKIIYAILCFIIISGCKHRITDDLNSSEYDPLSESFSKSGFVVLNKLPQPNVQLHAVQIDWSNIRQMDSMLIYKKYNGDSVLVHKTYNIESTFIDSALLFEHGWEYSFHYYVEREKRVYNYSFKHVLSGKSMYPFHSVDIYKDGSIYIRTFVNTLAKPRIKLDYIIGNKIIDSIIINTPKLRYPPGNGYNSYEYRDEYKGLLHRGLKLQSTILFDSGTRFHRLVKEIPKEIIDKYFSQLQIRDGYQIVSFNEASLSRLRSEDNWQLVKTINSTLEPEIITTYSKEEVLEAIDSNVLTLSNNFENNIRYTTSYSLKHMNFTIDTISTTVLLNVSSLRVISAKVFPTFIEINGTQEDANLIDEYKEVISSENGGIDNYTIIPVSKVNNHTSNFYQLTFHHPVRESDYFLQIVNKYTGSNTLHIFKKYLKKETEQRLSKFFPTGSSRNNTIHSFFGLNIERDGFFAVSENTANNSRLRIYDRASNSEITTLEGKFEIKPNIPLNRFYQTVGIDKDRRLAVLNIQDESNGLINHPFANADTIVHGVYSDEVKSSFWIQQGTSVSEHLTYEYEFEINSSLTVQIPDLKLLFGHFNHRLIYVSTSGYISLFDLRSNSSMALNSAEIYSYDHRRYITMANRGENSILVYDLKNNSDHPLSLSTEIPKNVNNIFYLANAAQNEAILYFSMNNGEESSFSYLTENGIFNYTELYKGYSFVILNQDYSTTIFDKELLYGIKGKFGNQSQRLVKLEFQSSLEYNVDILD